MSEPAMYSRTAAVLWRRVGDEVLVADPERSDVESLSLPASAAWLLLEGPQSTQDLIDALAVEYAAPPDEIAGNVTRLLSVLGQRGWVTRRSMDV